MARATPGAHGPRTGADSCWIHKAAVPSWVDWVLTASALTDGAKGPHDLQSKVQSSKGADEAT